MTGRIASMFHYVVVALLVLASSAVGESLHQTLLSSSPTRHLLSSLSVDPVLRQSRGLTHDLDLTPVPVHLSSLYALSKATDSLIQATDGLSQAEPTPVLHPSPSKDSVYQSDSEPEQDFDLTPTHDLQSSSVISHSHASYPLPSPTINPSTYKITHNMSTQAVAAPKVNDLITIESHALSPYSSSSHIVIHPSVPPFIPSPIDPYLTHLSETIHVPINNALSTSAVPPHHNTTAPEDGLSRLNSSSNINSATISQEEFNSILTRFSLDALQATQIAERLGLAGAGVAELEHELMLGGDLQGPGGPSDRPQALPLGRNVRTLPQRRMDSSISRATKRLFLGDPSLCYSGTCEFFLMCWLGGGLIDGGCGGFLFACCTRPNQRGQRGPESYREDTVGLVPVNYGPIRNDQDCGLSASSRLSAQRRIVGGTEAGFGSFPWQAYIRIGSSRCGGSLINQYHVVTAGHCVARARPHQIRVTLGDYVLNSEQEPLRPIIFGATDIKVHPNFKFTPQADRFDVAVITLDSPVHYQPHVQPICLPEKGTDWLGSYAWAAGWGALQSGSRLRPKTLQVVDVPILDSRLCEDWHRQKGINVIIYDEMMCAGYSQGGKDSCQGDSGGPLMIQDGGRWYLAGIVSAGYSCAQGKQPGIYHKVSYTSDWISWAAST
ncbi:uncharacterized protein LOC121861214 [Homarus americanus]|uniref:uncharacterized protein LOC121861214 n=1 Tax=Homarus americanus TaxID=6706 RepID=UPI001C480AEC|nr:uncharacterized protein LOC121861214 [Homarus americanus]